MADLKILRAQEQFLRSKARHVAYVSGVGGGKTWVAGEKGCQLVTKGAYVLAIAPSYKMLKLVLWQEIKDHAKVHGIAFDENKGDMVLDFPQYGGRIYGYSSESPDAIRGVTVDCAMYDEAAYMDAYVVDVVAGRCRRGKVPLQHFYTSTPNGLNWFYTTCMKKETKLIHTGTRNNTFLPDAFINELEARYDDEFAAQELNGEFIDSADGAQLISGVIAKEAQHRKPMTKPEAPIIAGLDVARMGDDRSCLVIRQDNVILAEQTWAKLDLVTMARNAGELAMEFGTTVLVIDSVGVGAGVFDILSQEIGNVVEVLEFNGGYRADSPTCSNLRAQTWMDMKKWLEHGQIPNNDEWLADLTSIRYFYNSRNLLALEGKDKMKRTGRKSPDIGDALAMTFWNKADRDTHTNIIGKAVNKFKTVGTGWFG